MYHIVLLLRSFSLHSTNCIRRLLPLSVSHNSGKWHFGKCRGSPFQLQHTPICIMRLVCTVQWGSCSFRKMRGAASQCWRCFWQSEKGQCCKGSYVENRKTNKSKDYIIFWMRIGDLVLWESDHLWLPLKLSHASAFTHRHFRTLASDEKGFFFSITFAISMQPLL